MKDTDGHYKKNENEEGERREGFKSIVENWLMEFITSIIIFNNFFLNLLFESLSFDPFFINEIIVAGTSRNGLHSNNFYLENNED